MKLREQTIIILKQAFRIEADFDSIFMAIRNNRQQ